MTTSSPTTAPRVTCPPWCVIHDGLEGPVGHEGVRTSISPSVSVGIRQVEGQDASPGLTIDADGNFVTEAEAHELGLALVRLADQLRRDRLAGDK